jgi:hypothetical protein
MLAWPLELRELHRLPLEERVAPAEADRERSLLAEAQLLPLCWLLPESKEEGLGVG